MEKPRAIAIVGPTASGKTALSIELAKEFEGEIVSADSRQVYTGLDLGTGKITKSEMAGIPHHLIDVTDPAHIYTAHEFELDATTAIMDIHSRGKLPIVAGGTFFYLDLLRGKHQPPAVPPNHELRSQLEEKSTEELFNELKRLDPERAASIDKHNRPRLIRALEIIDELGHVPKQKPSDSPYAWLVIGIDESLPRLHKNISQRLHTRLEQGLVEEVQKLIDNGLSFERLQDLGIEYRCIAQYLKQDISYQEMCEQIEIKSRQYAKRQLTWLKRDKEIQWFKVTDEILIKNAVSDFLGHES
jgi:tRNA dimethylallyltransferase